MRILSIIDKWLHNSWFNVGYLFASQILNLVVEGLAGVWQCYILSWLYLLLVKLKVLTMGVVSGIWPVLVFSGLSIYVGVLGALITWGAWLQPWLDKRQYIVYTVDVSLKHDGESMDDFMSRVREENLGRYEIVQ